MVCQPLANADEQVLAVGRDGHGGRIPAGRNEALDLALVRLGNVDDGNTVVIGVGDEQRLAVRCDGDGVRRAAGRSAREQRRANRLGDDAAFGIDDGDRVGRSTGDEKAVVFRMQDHLIRMLADD